MGSLSTPNLKWFCKTVSTILSSEVGWKKRGVTLLIILKAYKFMIHLVAGGWTRGFFKIFIRIRCFWYLFLFLTFLGGSVKQRAIFFLSNIWFDRNSQFDRTSRAIFHSTWKKPYNFIFNLKKSYIQLEEILHSTWKTLHTHNNVIHQ